MLALGPPAERETGWKQPLAEAARQREPLINSAARISQMGGDDYVLWLTTNPGPEWPASTTTETRRRGERQVLGPS